VALFLLSLPVNHHNLAGNITTRNLPVSLEQKKKVKHLELWFAVQLPTSQPQPSIWSFCSVCLLLFTGLFYTSVQNHRGVTKELSAPLFLDTSFVFN